MMRSRNPTMIAGAVGAGFGAIPILLILLVVPILEWLGWAAASDGSLPSLSAAVAYAWSLPSLILAMGLCGDNGFGILVLLVGPVLQWTLSAMLLERALRVGDRFAGTCLLLSALVVFASLWGLLAVPAPEETPDGEQGSSLTTPASPHAALAVKHRSIIATAGWIVGVGLALGGGTCFLRQPLSSGHHRRRPHRRRRHRK